MEQIFSQVLRPGTFVLALAVVVFTFFARRILERVFPSLRRAKEKTVNKDPDEAAVQVNKTYDTTLAYWWNEVILYAVPVLAGMSMGLMRSEFLHGDADTLGARILWAGGVGWFASFFYKSFRKSIENKLGVTVKEGPIEPPEV